MAGIRNANVFPVPVFDAPSISRPINACGIALDCICVARLYLRLDNTSIVDLDIFAISEKYWVEKYCS